MQANTILSIKGIINGTTNYILSAMSENGTSYEDALKSAQDEFAALQNSLPEATLSLYQNGGVGFRYILKYAAAWLRFKLFGRKDDGM